MAGLPSARYMFPFHHGYDSMGWPLKDSPYWVTQWHGSTWLHQRQRIPEISSPPPFSNYSRLSNCFFRGYPGICQLRTDVFQTPGRGVSLLPNAQGTACGILMNLMTLPWSGFTFLSIYLFIIIMSAATVANWGQMSFPVIAFNTTVGQLWLDWWAATCNGEKGQRTRTWLV